MVEKCPVCGKFISDVRAVFCFDGSIVKVNGICAVHGVVDITRAGNWTADDFDDRCEV